MKMNRQVFHLKSFSYFLLSCFFVIAIVYYYPRYLVKNLGEDSLWISYFYTYGIGLVFMTISVLWIFTRKKSRLRKREEWMWLLVIYTGLILSFLIHGIWIYLSISFPVKA